MWLKRGKITWINENWSFTKKLHFEPEIDICPQPKFAFINFKVFKSSICKPIW